MPHNEFQQEIGVPLAGWAAPEWPHTTDIIGHWCNLTVLEVNKHAADLYAEFSAAGAGLWTYMGYGPFADLAAFQAWMKTVVAQQDPLFYAITDKESGKALGQAAYLRITPAAGSIEVGHICYGPSLQQTIAATETMYLLMRHAFELGYRRYEWKCDNFNRPSQSAAKRLGFAYEGLFRQALVYKGRNRDTAWYSILDSEWPTLKIAYETWLSPANFDAQGQQRQRLSTLTEEALRDLR